MNEQNTSLDNLWQRVSRGRHTAVLGLQPPEPPASLNLRVVRISCDVPATTLGPLMEAAEKVERVLGGPTPLLGQARRRVVLGLRRRLLGDIPAAGAGSLMVETFNRLAKDSERRTALLFDAVDAADEATLEALRMLVARSGWLKLPLVLVFRSKEQAGAASALLDAIRAAEGPDALIAAKTAEAAEPPRTEPIAASEWSFRALPPDALRVLRAGAVVGSGFEASLIAMLLQVEPLDVLDCLQRAADAGAPIEDRGEGRFYLPEASRRALAESLLPSVALAWHRRLAAILSPVDQAGAEAPQDALEEAAHRSFAAPQREAPSAQNAADEAARERDMPSDLESTPEASKATEPAEPAVEAPRVDDERAIAPGPDAREQEEEEDEEASARPAQEQWPYAEIFARAAEAATSEESAAASPSRSESTGPGGSPEVRREDASSEMGTTARSSVEAEASRTESSSPGESSEAGGARAWAAARGEEEIASGPGAAATVREPVWVSPFAGAPRSRDSAEAFSAPDTAAGGGGERGEWSPAGAREASRASTEIPVREASHDFTPVRTNGARAAGHLTAAGEMDAAAAQYFEAAVQAAEMGAHPHALAYIRKALDLLEELPVSPRRRRLRIQILAGLGRLQWQAAGPELSFTLAGALEALEEAGSLLQDGDPPDLTAEVAVLIASVCYDIGDLRSLERALDALTHASRVLLSVGDATGAAKLLNDQAAVYVRMGDPVRATHLLSESRKVFEQRSATDPVAMIELAETDHLFARIPLHVAARPGREADAMSMGLDHALAAERTYKKLGAKRELGRVWETMGRLELRRGRLERAAERLTAAMKVQESIGDILGLARTTAAFSEVLAAGGRYRDALTVLADSVTLNLEKGSPIGLAFNRRSLEALAKSAPPGEGIAEGLKQVAAHLRAAESVLGTLRLPGERD